MDKALTSLETEVIERLHTRYASYGIPSASNVVVSRRECPSFAKFIYLQSDADINLPDCELVIGKYSAIIMEPLQGGLNISVHISSRRLHKIEFLVIGDEHWDGLERSWTFLEDDEESAE